MEKTVDALLQGEEDDDEVMEVPLPDKPTEAP